jgi:multidrug efflux pump subunit AcrB
LLMKTKSEVLTRPQLVLVLLLKGPLHCRDLALRLGIGTQQLGGTLASMLRRRSIDKLERGLYTLTINGRYEARQLMATNPAAVEEAQAPTAKRQKEPYHHWIVTELFNIAKQRWPEKQDEMLEAEIQRICSVRIPANTLRYWRNGWSTPKVSEADQIAKALGYELEIMKS